TGVTSFTFNGIGSTTLVVQFPTGASLVSGGIFFNGGTGPNTLKIEANGLSVVTRPGTVLVGNAQSVSYSGVQAINLNNTTSVSTFAGPNTASRTTAFVGLTAQERYIQALYLDVLGRAGSVGELDGWLTALNG